MYLLLLLQAATGRIEGTVSSDAGAPISGATVAIAAIDRTARTDSVGRFALPALAAGTWRVRVSAAGFQPVELQVEVATAATVRVDIGLTPTTVDRTLPTLDVEVREPGGAPIDLATVELDGQVRTALGGLATFRDVPPGSHTVRARRLGYAPSDTTLVVGGAAMRVIVRLTPRPRDLPTLAVSAPRRLAPPPIAAPGDLSGPLTTVLTRLDREQLQAVPPAFEPDVLRALQATTGVGAANDVNAHLAIRGSAPEHTLYLLDGAPVLGPYHMFGLFGAFNPDAVDDAQILRGSLPARIGGALGSVVSLRSARPDRFRLVGGATVLASRVAASGPIGGAGSWLVAGRRTNLGFGRNNLVDLEVPYWFWDLQGTLRLAPAPHQEITISTYGSGDKFSEDLFFIKEGSAPLFSTWRNRVASASWRYAPAAGWGGSVAFWTSGYRSTLALGDTTLRADSAATQGNTRLTGFSAAIGRDLPRGTVRAALELTDTRARLVGDSVAPGYLDDRIDRRVTEVAGSLEWEHRIGAVTVAPGLRATRWNRGDAWSVEPRFAMRMDFGRGGTVTAGVSRTVQALYALRDDLLPILGVPFWILPDSTDPRATATAFEVSVALPPANGWRVEASLFHRRLAGLARWRPTGKRDLSELEYDDGTASGLELLVSRRTGRITGWASYTPIVASYRPATGGSYRPLWDRRQTIDAVTQIKLGRWGVLSQRVAFATSQPFWVEQGMFTGSEFDPGTGTARARNDASFPIWSSTQGTLPYYFRADLTVTAGWQFGRVRVSPFAGLINLTGRRNVTGYRAQPGGLTGTIEYLPRRQLPRVPVLGIDFSLGPVVPR